jgi:hypothetical protein
MKRLLKGSDAPEVVNTGQGTIPFRWNGFYALKGPEQKQARYSQVKKKIDNVIVEQFINRSIAEDLESIGQPYSKEFNYHHRNG